MLRTGGVRLVASPTRECRHALEMMKRVHIQHGGDTRGDIE
jgi:hypothetical protein